MMWGMPAYCLSMHVPYVCRGTGACCTAAWPIRIETRTLSALRTRGVPNADSRPIEGNPDDPSAPATVGRTPSGACVFYETERGGTCAIHRTAGVDFLPAACRNFPRVTLRDPRGIFVTLSHFCPTAARLLLAPGGIAIVEAPAAISLDGRVEGLDATAVMPPLLRPGMMMDLEGYGSWEREGLAVLDVAAYSARQAVAIIRAATETARTWSPALGPLSPFVGAAFRQARAAAAAGAGDNSPPAFVQPLKRFLAAHLFASWAAYQPAASLMAVVESLEQALSLAGSGHRDAESFIASVRQADLRLRHS